MNNFKYHQVTENREIPTVEGEGSATLNRRMALFCFALAGAFLIALLIASTVLAEAPDASMGPKQPQVTGGQFTVNTINDDTISDAYLTLREAILLVNGGTGASGLNRPLNAGEINQISSCIISGGFINNGCGPGFSNTIIFQTGASTTILVLTPLPAITTDGTTIDGSPNTWHLAMASLGSGNGLFIASNHNTIQNLTISKSPSYGLRIDGDYNTISSFWVESAKWDGIVISGSNNTITGTSVGGYTTDTTCGNMQGNGQYGLHLMGGAASNRFEYGSVGCNTNGGVYIESTAGDSNVIGPKVNVGENQYLNHSQGNTGPGIIIDSNSNGVISTTVMNNTVGVRIGGSYNTIGGSVIDTNSGDGIYLHNNAGFNRIGLTGLLGPQLGNAILNNSGWGVNMFGAQVNNTYIAANRIGSKMTNLTSSGNALGGVRVFGGHDNQVGDNNHWFDWNYIVANGGDGILISNGAYDNGVNHNIIGMSSYSNSGNGITVDSGSYNTTIGGTADWLKNNIEKNDGNGIAINGSTTTSNTITGDLTSFNSQNGVLIDGAPHNTITSIYDQDNLKNGILITNTAQFNLVSGGRSEYNGLNGIQLGGVNTYINIISGTIIDNNTVNGIDERDGALSNQWSHLNMGQNGAKGIDLHWVPAITPIIMSVSGNGVITIASGMAIPSIGFPDIAFVEVYASTLSQSGNPEGRSYLGTAAVMPNGVWWLSLPSGAGLCITAFESHGFYGTYSGEFSQNTCRVFMPFAKK